MSQAEDDVTVPRVAAHNQGHHTVIQVRSPAPIPPASPSDLYCAFDQFDNDGEDRAINSPVRGAGGSKSQNSSRDMLWVQVVAGVGIPAADKNGKSDPYVILTIEPEVAAVSGQPTPLRQRLETRRCNSTLEPIWAESFSFSLEV